MSRLGCDACDDVHGEATGAPREGFPAGTPRAQVPDEWSSSDCAVREKVDVEQVPESAGADA